MCNKRYDTFLVGAVILGIYDELAHRVHEQTEDALLHF